MRAGANYMSATMCSAYLYENASNDSVRLEDPYSSSQQGRVSLQFSTTPGKTYMLDLAVGGGEWKLSAMINQPSMQAQDGHLMLGFTAAESTHSLTVRKPRNRSGSFYSCELRAID